MFRQYIIDLLQKWSQLPILTKLSSIFLLIYSFDIDRKYFITLMSIILLFVLAIIQITNIIDHNIDDTKIHSPSKDFNLKNPAFQRFIERTKSSQNVD